MPGIKFPTDMWKQWPNTRLMSDNGNFNYLNEKTMQITAHQGKHEISLTCNTIEI